MRRDIQVLRGWAILLVLLYHANVFGALRGGWLGVDLFFVLSGYLISGMVARDLAAGTFSFQGFYFRRAKRLLPAAYVVMALCIAAAPWLLVGKELKDFAHQVVGGITLSANVALWLQTGYFEGAAALKPLLHFWSLAIEEQYYLVLPLCLFLAPRKFWGVGAIVVTTASLALCIVMAGPKPAAAFYLLPTRAWELGLGSLVALCLDGVAARAWLSKLAPWFLPAVLVVPFLPVAGARPGVLELSVCVLTAVLLVGRVPLLEHSRLLAPLAWLGNISYSLYLIHWPLIAFLGNIWTNTLPVGIRWLVVLVSIGAAWFSYRFVEMPFRRMNFSGRAVLLLAGSGAVVLLLFALSLSSVADGRSRSAELPSREPNRGFGPKCDFGDRYFPESGCQSGGQPQLLVWGDSFAMHLVGGLQSSATYPFAQATKSSCAAADGLAKYPFNREWARGCLQFTTSVMHAVAQHSEWEVVVLASPFDMFLEGSLLANESIGANGDSSGLVQWAVVDGSEDRAITAFTATIRQLRAHGKRVLVVAPPPNTDFDIGLCLERRALSLPVFGADNADCSIDAVRYRQLRGSVYRFLDRLSREADVPVYRMDDYLCDEQRCITTLDGVPLYRDDGHLSVAGSRVLGKAMNWGPAWWAMAR